MSEVIIRNTISNTNFIIEYNLDMNLPKEANDSHKFLEELINFDSQQKDSNNANKDRSNIQKENDVILIDDNLTSTEIPNTNFSNSYINPDFINHLSNNNIIFKHMMYLITEQDYKFKPIHNKNILEDYIKNLDSTPVYITYNCGILYVPNKGKLINIKK